MRKYGLYFIVTSLLIAQPGGVDDAALWLRADTGVHGGTIVSQWDDQSGNNRNAVQGNMNYRPTFVDNDAPNGGNFNPTLHYTNHFLDAPYDPDLNGADLTVFVVVDLDGGSSWRSPWTTRDDNPSRGHIMYYNSGYRYWTGNGTSGGWNQLMRGDTSNRYEMLTTTSEDRNNGSIRKSIFLQGRYLGNHTVNFSPNTQRPFRIGKGATERNDGVYPWYGDIAEIIVYPERLSSNNRRKIESYLAIKYGITLDQSNNGKNYYDSSGTTIWHVSNNDGYGYDIAGLGRDDISALDQRISHSINSDAIITIATNQDFSSSNLNQARPTLSNQNRRFLMWSNNDNAHGWTTSGAPQNGKILERKWKVQKTRTGQNSISLQVDTDDADFNMDSFSGTLYFLKGVDLSQATPISMHDDGNGKWHIDNIDFEDGDLFSFAIDLVLPNIHISKSSIVLDDPVNSNNNPKRIPGATIRYCFTVDNMGEGNADNVKIDDSLTGNGKDNLIYVKAGSMIQNISTACDCTSSSMDDTKGSISGTDVTIDIGTLTGTGATATSRGCAYIEMTIQ